MIQPGTTVGIAGAGAMGTGIAQIAAAAGHAVVLYDTDPAALERSEKSLRAALDKLVAKNKMQPADAKALAGRIEWTGKPGAFAPCALMIEAVIEDLAAKRQLLGGVEQVVGEQCVLATNTSSLSIASIAAACQRPGRVLGLHFFNPAPVMPLVEVVPGLATDPGLVSPARELMKRWGKMPVTAKDTPGFIVNRIARPFYGEALRIYDEGLANAPAIDAAMKAKGFKMGPFELMDFIGHDVNYAVSVSVWEQLYYDPRYRPSVTQKRLCEAGRLGRKSGRGFYDYDNAMPQPAAESELSAEAIFLRILCMLVNEAADALYYGLAGKDDIETAMTRGVNYPKGLLHWCDELGAGVIYNELLRLRDEYSEDRYRPSVVLKKMAGEKGRFFS
jgi:3-hydroxybutyryl-CoA dehydrogenase